MAIEEIIDRKTKKPELLASGVISAVYYNALREVKNRGTAGKDWFPTHTVSIIVDGDKIGLGLTDKDGKDEHVGVKDVDGNWHDLAKGMEVTITVTKGEPYNGKDQYNAYSKDVVVIDVSGVQKAQQQSKNDFKAPSSGFKKDNSGIIAGNAFNAAKALLVGSEFDNDDLIATAKNIMNIGAKLRTEYAEANPSANDYEVGAQVGMAIIAASEWASDVEEIEELANDVLNNVIPELNAYAKAMGEKKEEKKEAPAKKKPVTKTAPKKTASETKKNVEEPPPSDFEDDIPF